MESTAIAIVVSFSTWIFGGFGFFIIGLYHRKKPLGLQTLLGKVVILFVNTFGIVSTFNFFLILLVLLLPPIHTLPAKCLTLFGKFFVTSLKYFVDSKYHTGISEMAARSSVTICTIYVLVTKYLLIYHGPRIQSLNEDILLKILTRMTLMVPILVAIVEYVYFNDIRTSACFQLLVSKRIYVVPHAEVMSIIIFIFSCLIGLTLQVRLELDTLKFKEHSGCLSRTLTRFRCCHWQDRQAAKEMPYKIGFLRIVFSIGLSFASMVLIYAIVGTDSPHTPFLINYVLFFLVCPWLFILNHQRLRSMAFNISSHIKHSPPIIIING